jgi:hypothetical protein
MAYALEAIVGSEKVLKVVLEQQSISAVLVKL